MMTDTPNHAEEEEKNIISNNNHCNPEPNFCATNLTVCVSADESINTKPQQTDAKLSRSSESNYSLIWKVDDIEKDEENPYELIQRGSSISKNDRVSISRMQRRRPKGNKVKSMYVVGDSMIGYKDGVPGSFSPVSVSNRREVKSVPVFPEEITLLPERPPRKNRLKLNSNQARIYDQVFESTDEEMRKSSTSSNESKGEDGDNVGGPQHVIISSGSVKVETGVRIFDPSVKTRRQSSTVVLPVSLNDELSESDEESWGSDFEESFREEEEVYEVLGKPKEGVGSIDNNYERIESFGREPSTRPKPPLPPRQCRIFQSIENLDLEKDMYVEVNIDDEMMFPAVLPPLEDDADEFQLKRYQIVKCILENEKVYVTSLNRLINEYEMPLRKRNIISDDRIKVIFRHVHEIIQCHQLFSMALTDRTKEWSTNDVIGDVIYASFSKSMALKAYTSFVHNFSYAMESIKETCKLVPAFLSFLKNHLNRNSTKQSLYDLMRQPLERIPQLVTLTQELTKITPLLHPDHFPLQMALTHLECFSETLAEKKRDSMYKHKVRQLDNYCIGLEKPLSSKNRYYVRHDDMILCIVDEGKIVKTKLRRLFILNDLLICAGILTKPKKLKSLTSKKFQIKWCVPINDVQILDVGSGISFQSHKQTLTTKYSHVSSPRPGVGDAPKVLEDLQHDIEVIGEIVGKVSSLRRKYRFIDIKKVTQWYNDVKSFYERERELVNMNWIEIAIPSKDPKNENIRYLFNVHSADKRMEWLAEFENVKLRLTHNNNPGWYLQEDNIYDGEAAVLRRTLPLLSNLMPMFIIENKHKVTCSLEVSMTTTMKPILWLFSGSDHLGMITLMEMDMTSVPKVMESFVACETRICCAERVPEDGFYSLVPYIQNVSVWVGTMAGRILLFDPNIEERYPSLHTTLKDAVISLKYCRNRMFAGLANGTLACFRRKVEGNWDLSNPTIVCLDTNGVLSMTEVVGHLWCGCASNVYVVNTVTLAIERKLTVEGGGVKHLVAYGIGVWVSSWRSSKLQLYHAETLDQLQTLNVSTAVSRMKNDIDINVEKIVPEKLYVTSIMARSGLLWVGTDQGLILTYPLPKLGGIPKVNGSACISFHGHDGPVRHLYAFKVQKQNTQNSTKIGKIEKEGELHGEEEGRRSSRFYRSAFEEVDELGLSIEALDQVADDEGGEGGEGGPLPVYFEVEADRGVNKSEENGLFVNEAQQHQPTTDYAEYDNESSYYDKESVDQPINGNDDQPDQSSTSGIPDESTEIGLEETETPEVDLLEEAKEKKAEPISKEVSNEEREQIVVKTEKSDHNTENIFPEEAPAVVEIHDAIVGSSEPLDASTPAKDNKTTTVIPAQSELIVDTTGDEGGEKTYESPVPPVPQKGLSKNDTLDSNVSSTDLNDTWSVVCDHYKTLPLPNSPWHSYQEASAGQDTPSLPLDPKNYTPLIAESDGRENTFASSITSAVNFKDFERELSFGPSLADKVDGDGNYASLVAHSKREVAARKDALLKPCYVVSIGVGHIDFRRPSKRGSKTAEFFRALSTGGAQPESMLIAWKIS
ncbi:rho guanine nucleotide exchange factor 10-like isoform X2 [Clytia hemisphaerica]|uniref:DH domain-containing protein n=1 Tax=Clytia hemisphaerica TaxID=252671 RepID=A0A7M5X5W8_9CNID